MTAFRGAALCAAAALAVAAGIGCGSSSTSSGGGGGTTTGGGGGGTTGGGGGGGTTGGGGGGGGTTTTGATGPVANQLNFQIVSADLAPAGGAKPNVRFKVTDASGAPINLAQEIQNDATSTASAPVYPRMRPRFVVAQFNPQTTDYTSYYQTTATNNQTTPATTVPIATFDPPTRNAQGQPAPFPTSQLVDEGGGVWRYEFTQPFTTPNLQPAPQSRNTVGVFAQRTLAPTTQGGAPMAYNASATQSFIQGGGNQDPPFAAVADAACNTCHEPALQGHGFRRGTQLCITCHSPQTKDPTSTTGGNVDFKSMIHRIHSGANLPSVQGGNKLVINGTDFSDVEFPRERTDCTACHQQAAQADVWKTTPTVTACTACHDTTSFDPATASAAKKCNDPTYDPATDKTCQHSGGLFGANPSDTLCAGCHASSSSVAPVDKVHVTLASVATNYKTEVVNLALGAGGQPTVTYKVTKPDGSAWDLATAQSFNIQIGWQQPEFTNSGTPNATPSQPIRLAGSTATPTSDPTTFQVVGTTAQTAVPTAVKNVRVWVEGHPVVNNQNIPVVNSFKDFPVNGGGAITPRPQIVATQNCNVCHGVVSAHGGNRNGAVEVCMVCHNPNATDIARSSQPSTNGAKQQTIDFKVLIHAVHGADIRTTPFVVWGFGTPPTGNPPAQVTFPAPVPANTANCAVCHVNTTFAPPLPSTTLGTAFDATNPDASRVPPTISTCTACHSTTQFDASAASAKKCSDPTYNPSTDGNCQHSGGLIGSTSDASCAGCHQVGGIADVQKIHSSFVH